MTITFAPYQLNSGSFALRRQPRLRLSDQQNVFALRRQPRLAMTGGAVTHVSMPLRQPAPRLRMSDRQNVFVLHRQPELAMSGATPLPSASVFMLTGPGHTLAMTTIITTHATMALHRQPQLLMTDASARFALDRTPRLYLSDGRVSMDRTALLLQQPELYASAVLGMTMGLVDSFTATDAVDPDFVLALLDLFQASDAYSQQAQVLQALADGMTLADVAAALIEAELVDSFIASAVLDHTAQVTVLLADTATLGDGLDALSTILLALRDGFYATVALRNGDDTFTAWVMTTQTKAMRSYSNWPFNSYALLGGAFLGAGPDGIYRMGGDKDAGEAIRWAVRTGKLDFGQLAMKGAPLVYIGATASGDLLLKVTATTVRGQEMEQTYRMTPARPGEMREHRVPVGRGFRSVYWTFETCNDADGATATVHEWHAVPTTHTGKLI